MEKSSANFNSILYLVLAISICVIASCSVKYDLTQSPTEHNVQAYEDFIIENAPSRDAFIALQRITEPLLDNKNFDGAVKVYNNYDSLFQTKEASNKIKKIVSILNAEQEDLIITNLVSINTVADEYAPVLSLNEEILYFTSRNRVGGSVSEDIFYSKMQDGHWQTAQNIGREINTTRKSESLDAVSPDGAALFLMGDFKGSYGNGDIFTFEFTDEGWSNIKHLPSPVNTSNFEANAYLTADGKALLFTSDRPGGIGDYNPKGLLFNGGYIGNTDIYVSEKTLNGWEKPINLGKIINTPYAEYSPFLHPDGKTLYFSSDGHAGIGRMDVFKAVRTNLDSWTEWSEPENLGKEINTPENDWGYRISLSGEVAYFATEGQRGIYGGFGGYDIYTITLPERVKPDPVTIVKGVVMDEDGNPLYADITWTNVATGILVSEIKSDLTNGTFMVVLKPEEKYQYDIVKKGFYTVSNSILTGKRTEVDTLISLNIKMLSFEEIKEKKIAITIDNIFFEFNKYDLLPESFVELNKLAQLLIDNPEQYVEISGHTDNVGSASYNQELSEKRARSVVDYLISKGCISDKLSSKGYGLSKPIAPNDYEEGRAKNRRVEFRIK